MAYTAAKPKIVPDSNSLRAQIQGWGVDLDPKDRPASQKERFVAGRTGAHWEFPDRQVPTYDRERSPEHKFLTPVFGTTCPPKGLSGVIRRYAYRLSEGRTAHWGLLMFADRVDVLESGLKDLLRGRPDNVIREYGISAELKYRGFQSRWKQSRADLKRIPLEFIVMTGAGFLIGAAAFSAGRGIRNRVKSIR